MQFENPSPPARGWPISWLRAGTPMRKPLELRGGLGVRNDVTPERFSLVDLQAAVNIDIDETQKLSRRGGRELVRAGSYTSLWAHREWALVVRESSLVRVNSDMTETTMASGIGPRVAYEYVNGEVYLTDGARSLVVSSAGVRPWGMPVPPQPAVASAGAVGFLPEGRYLVGVTYVDAAGRESGASSLRVVSVPDNGAFDLALATLAPEGAVGRRIYVSGPDGEAMFEYATLPMATTSLRVATVDHGPAMRTSFMGPPPAGARVVLHGARLYVARGQYLYYTQPYEYDLYDQRSGFIAFPSEVRVVARVSDGLFVATESETVFLRGLDPTEFQYVMREPFGGVLGSEVEVPGEYVGDTGEATKVAMWASERGVMLGSPGGGLQCVTKTRYTMPASRRGASVLKVPHGTPQFLCSLFR